MPRRRGPPPPAPAAASAAPRPAAGAGHRCSQSLQTVRAAGPLLRPAAAAPPGRHPRLLAQLRWAAGLAPLAARHAAPPRPPVPRWAAGRAAAPTVARAPGGRAAAAGVCERCRGMVAGNGAARIGERATGRTRCRRQAAAAAAAAARAFLQAAGGLRQRTNAHLLQLGCLLGATAQQGVGQGSCSVGRAGAVSRGAGIGPRHQVAQAAHGGDAGQASRQPCATGVSGSALRRGWAWRRSPDQ